MKKTDPLLKEIDRLKKALMDEEPYDKNYTILLSRIAHLEDMRRQNRRFTLSGDTILVAGVNLLGILLILHHERLHAVSTKALGFVTKLRL